MSETSFAKKEIILFGAGKLGRAFMKHLPRNAVKYMVDNYRANDLQWGGGVQWGSGYIIQQFV